MSDGQVIEFVELTKYFGTTAAVAGLSARVVPGIVTGFLGPNGAGKTTTLKMLLGQVRPTSGSVTIGGALVSDIIQPLRTIGAVMESPTFRPRRTASRLLTLAAKANGIPLDRVGKMLTLVGLHNDADTRLGTYSLGMRQRLSVATALLGDPGVVVLDEPANGLDPEGIRWMRLLMRRLADDGKTVLVSSHVLSEIEQVADEVLVISRGKLAYSGAMSELADPSGGPVVVDAVDRDALVTALTTAGIEADVLRSGLTVRGSDSATVGAVAAAAGISLTTLLQRGPTLEDIFLDLVHGRRPAIAGASMDAQAVETALATGNIVVPPKPVAVPAVDESVESATDATDEAPDAAVAEASDADAENIASDFEDLELAAEDELMTNEGGPITATWEAEGIITSGPIDLADVALATPDTAADTADAAPDAEPSEKGTTTPDEDPELAAEDDLMTNEGGPVDSTWEAEGIITHAPSSAQDDTSDAASEDESIEDSSDTDANDASGEDESTDAGGDDTSEGEDSSAASSEGDDDTDESDADPRVARVSAMIAAAASAYYSPAADADDAAEGDADAEASDDDSGEEPEEAPEPPAYYRNWPRPGESNS